MRPPRRRILLLALGLGACAPRLPPAPPAPSGPSVSCRPDGPPLPAAAGRERLCVVDIGSRNVKLAILSRAGDDPRSIREDRVCRSRMQLGEKVFDMATKTPRPLATADQTALVRLIGDFGVRCARDGGRMVGMLATEWARRATNPDEIRASARSGAGAELEILTREREGRYGYLAATRGAMGRIALDFGSRSIQLSFWPKGGRAPEIASLPLGIDEAGDRFFGEPEHKSYRAARAAYAAQLRVALGPALKRMRKELRAGRLEPQLYSLAENGDVALAVAGKLWDGGRRCIDEATYAALVKEQARTPNPEHGLVTAVIPARDIVALTRGLTLDPTLFEALRGEGIKRIYGYKMLAYPALLALLSEEVGLETVVLVPQELSLGLVIDRLRGR